MLSDGDFDDIIGQFPDIDFGFAYGSGVVRQEGYDYSAPSIKKSSKNLLEDGIDEKELPMVDMIFAVKDPEAWHAENMALNPSHYTPMRTLTAWDIAQIQDNYGAGMWYNAMIAMNISSYPTRLMKYGVISRNR